MIRFTVHFFISTLFFVFASAGLFGQKKVQLEGGESADGLLYHSDGKFSIGTKTNKYETRTQFTIEPPIHTGGPWRYATQDIENYAFLHHYYGSQYIMTLKHTGNVGIGVSDPEATLDVKGGNGGYSGPTLNLRSDSNNSAWSLIHLKGGTFDDVNDYMIGRGRSDFHSGRALTLHVPSRSSFYGGEGEYPKISFVSSGGQSLGYVESETGNWYMKGNVGVGYTSPKTKLHIIGDPTMPDKYGALVIGPTGDKANLRMGYTDDYSWIQAHGSRPLYINYIGNNTILNRNGGGVAIGMDNPGEYQLAVKGKVKAQEIKVSLVGWSDFVFEKDYDLPSLSEVEAHIKEKGHLEHIPSAGEVEKEGVDLGAMDAKLLRKIEELTLYAIEQEKRIKELEVRNKAVETENRRLKGMEEDIKLLRQMILDIKKQ
ncbi:hypothetical protein FUAX_53150 (plasmid) [Fulvitalea axinellae]|uniref:Uncharacterized protein n=1 Tax=Fulvitalea axinellae TaxID=1182444 RepID=A0AAU9CRY0_9BACT|nr:hypothetical protein FUAX_53150 [Fulvitalea axinellae]